ncbi:hypothetical protein [Acinetobacter sp.]|uniref:hypothetical protein n=1 Tax=Acinetobacter sp. TaxID=472 RepID=UPI003750FABA
MNKLSEQEIDKELMDRDERKPVRKVVDDYVVPVGGAVVGGAAAAVGALTHLQTVDKRKTIE